MVPLQRLTDVFAQQRARRWEIGRAPAPTRVEKLRRLKKAIVTHREDLLSAMHADFRKPRSEAELSELQLVLTELNHAISHLPRWMQTTAVPTPMHMLGTRSEIRHQPRGVVLILAAWNYPFALLFAPLVAAIAAGNTVMLRPSERVPHTNALADRILAEAFEESEVALVGGGRETADALLALPFDHIFFTGSSPVGRAILEKASRHLPSVTLELGGKSPAIVDETADVPAAARAVMWGKFVNAGQTCVAPDYALVHASHVQAFVAESRRALDTFYGASPELKAKSGDLCRIIDQASFDRLSALLDGAVSDGARIETGGDRNAAERYLAPTLLSGVRPTSEIMADEIFGPVLPILTFTTRAEAAAFVRSRPTPLVLYLFATGEPAINEILAATASGGAVINNTLIHLLNPDLPFGGAGASGFGAYHGEHGFRSFSHQRSVVYQRKPNLTSLFHPPYARLRSGLLGKVLAFVRRMRD